MVQQRSDLCMRPSNLRMHSRDRRHHGNPTQIAKKQRKIDRANHSGNTVQRHVKISFRMEVAGTDHNSPVGETQNIYEARIPNIYSQL